MTARDLTIPLTDDALPGLERATAPARLGHWLGEATGRDVRVVPRRLRYKPGVSLVMAIDVLPADAPDGDASTRHCLVRAYASDAGAKLLKTVSASPDSVLGYDARASLMVTTAAGDRDLPLLARLQTPEGLRQVVDRVLPDHPELGSACVRTLRHNPERRWVGLLETGGRPTVLLRGYRSKEVKDRFRAYSALEGGTPRTPAVLGWSRSYGVVAVEWVPGRELAACAGREDWLAGGATLGRLHDRADVSLHHVSGRHHADGVLEAAELVARLLPGSADSVLGLARDVEHRIRLMEHERSPVHGDFSPDQVIVSDDGGTALVDLDRAHLGDPAADLGCAVADVMTETEESGDVGRGRHVSASLVEGYATARRPPTSATIATYALAYRIRKAAEPFRACRPDWPALVAARVQRAEAARELLSGGSWG